VFFEDHSGTALQDDILSRLLTFPNVLVTSHQAFLTEEALHAIAETTIDTISHHIKGEEIPSMRVVV
jgi:D-lactate dehydrogenase